MARINSPFHKLAAEKKQRIMNAAFEEFIQKGYEQASTNAIVKRAGIGKGTLFHYFNSKKDLFLFLLDHCIDISDKEYIDKIDTTEGDIIKRFRDAALLKKRMMAKYPYLSDFILVAFSSNSSELINALHERRQTLEKKGIGRIYENIDTTLFKDDLDVEKALQLITWALDGYRNENERKLKGKTFTLEEFDLLHKEFDEYLEVLKKAFYK
ncbi:TetR/AcrR family transcriptional regulator [Bacillus shivajii]|uniref:TetR/AcrR family transcriptional regulator n=1 Tax=Bacillus shivajii TaxID=1983719 RepID=UPI001CFB6B54|nr:TetR/AcrR family transcriptional regulator [Bacillus shivajii]UCZ53575.1 TetR/AcrR family transcriptional regulator [Bacillus shivajii]